MSFFEKPLDFPHRRRYNKTRSPARTPREYAPVAQLDRVSDYESEGRGFESLPAHQGHLHLQVTFFVYYSQGSPANQVPRQLQTAGAFLIIYYLTICVCSRLCQSPLRPRRAARPVPPAGKHPRSGAGTPPGGPCFLWGAASAQVWPWLPGRAGHSDW